MGILRPPEAERQESGLQADRSAEDRPGRDFHGPFALIAFVWTMAFFWIYRPVIASP